LQKDRQPDDVRMKRTAGDRNAERVDIAVGVGGGLGNLGQIRADEYRNDRGVKRRVGPVVDVPPEEFAAIIQIGRASCRERV